MSQPHAPFAPKIYYFHPFLAGPRESREHHLRRCRTLGFDFVLTAPFFAPGESGDIFLTADYEHVHPVLAGAIDVDGFVAAFAQTCAQHGLQLLTDIVFGRLARDAQIAKSEGSWFHGSEPVGQRVDPRSALQQPHAV